MLDLVLLRKEADGSVEAAELADVDESDVGALRALEADLAMLLAEEDVEEIGKALEPGSIAAVLVYENTLGRPVRLVDPPGRRPAHRQRPHPDAGAAGRDRSRPTNRDGRSLTCHWPEDEPVDGASSADR